MIVVDDDDDEDDGGGKWHDCDWLGFCPRLGSPQYLLCMNTDTDRATRLQDSIYFATL